MAAMLVCGLSLSLSACTQENSAEANTANLDAELTDSHHRPIHLSDYRGKWLVINYWATWCQPCLTELPELNQLYLNHELNHGKQVSVLAVNFDGLSHDEINQFAHRLQLKLPLLSRFPIGQYGVENIPTLPVTFLISPQGKLSKTLYGQQTQASLLHEMGIAQ